MTKTTLVHPPNLKEERVFALTATDCLQAAIPPIAFALFYNHVVDIQLFQRALEGTLGHFPLLAGRIHRTTDRKLPPFQVKVHPRQGGALLAITKLQRAYPTRDDRRWFPRFTGAPWPTPHEPNFTFGPLLKIKITQIVVDSTTVVSFSFCHSIMDATTVGAFLETLQAHYNHSDAPSSLPPQIMSLDRVTMPTGIEKEAEPLDRFTIAELARASPRVIHSSILIKHLNLIVETAELSRLKEEFLQALNGESEWVSSYEMLGVILLRAFYQASRKELSHSTAPTELECRCVVDPRSRSANPYVNSTHPGNVAELPSIRLSYQLLEQNDPSWKKLCLQEFHSQLRSALTDPQQMTQILKRAHVSYQRGDLHTKEGRLLSSKVFARNMTEPNVCSYNSWLHLDWFQKATLGTARPHHFQVATGLACPDMFWVFPRTPTQVTIRTTLPPAKARRFLEELRRMNLAFEVQ